jgi:sugar/nucleoside kinase (ribokinase family)
MRKQPDIVVLGDINLDLVTAAPLPFKFAELRENGRMTWAVLDELPGGSGLNFARFALEAGFQPLLLGCIGQDVAGGYLRDWLNQKGISAELQVSANHSTGRAFIARDANDIRFLVNNAPNANADLDTLLVDREEARIRAAALLYVSGYCIQQRQSPRFTAALRAMEIAGGGAGKTAVVFDVVPHRIYETYSFAEFLRITSTVDVLISEVATMRRFLGLGDRSEVIDATLARETLNQLSRYYRGCILRYGPSGCDMELLWRRDANDEPVTRETGHAQAADKRGYGDLLAIKTLRDFFGLLPK